MSKTPAIDQKPNFSDRISDGKQQISNYFSDKKTSVNKTATDLYEVGSKKAHEGKDKIQSGIHEAGHQAHLAGHRSVTTSPYSIIDVKKGLTIGGILAGAAIGAYYATTAAITITLVLTPAIVLAAAAAVVAVATLWSLVANALTKPTLPSGTDELDVDTDVQAALNALDAEEARFAQRRTALLEVKAKKEQERLKFEKEAEHNAEQAGLASASA